MPHTNNDLSLALEASFKSFEIDTTTVESRAKLHSGCLCFTFYLIVKLKHLTEFSKYFGVALHIRIVLNGKAY